MSSPKIYFLLQVHKFPQLVARLVNHLLRMGEGVIIHVDRKVDITPFKEAIPNQARVYWVRKRQNVLWAGFSQAKATLHSLEEALSNFPDLDYVFFLSGQDYPLVSAPCFRDFFEEHNGKEFIFGYPFSNEGWWEHNQYRIKNFHFFDLLRIPRVHLLDRYFNRFFAPRTFPLGLTPYGCTNWWCLTKNAIRHLFLFLKNKASYYRFFLTTYCGDEIFFQTFLYNSQFRDSIFPDHLRYFEFSPGKPNPKVLDFDDFAKLKNSGKFFARKFDEPLSAPSFLDQIDSELLGL